MTPPALADGDGFPFKLISFLPYRPDDFSDWREANHAFLFNHFFDLAHRDAVVPQLIGTGPIGDGVAVKS